MPVPTQVMRLRRAVPKIPAKSSYPVALPFYKSHARRTHLGSTLLQPLIPLHFNSFISNTYKKPGGGCPLPAPMFCNSSLAARPSCAHTATPLYAERRGRRATRRAHEHLQVPSLLLLGESVQISENTATLSPFPATLTDTVNHKSCVCHSYKKHRGWGTQCAIAATLRHYLLTSLLHRAIVLRKG